MRNQWLIREEESVFFRDEPLMGSSSSVAKYTILGTGHEFEREYRRDVGRVGERKRETMQILQSHMKFSKKKKHNLPVSPRAPYSHNPIQPAYLMIYIFQYLSSPASGNYLSIFLHTQVVWLLHVKESMKDFYLCVWSSVSFTLLQLAA